MKGRVSWRAPAIGLAWIIYKAFRFEDLDLILIKSRVYFILISNKNGFIGENWSNRSESVSDNTTCCKSSALFRDMGKHLIADISTEPNWR